MDETKLLPLVEKTLIENGVKYKTLDCKPELADTTAFCSHYGIALEQSANTILVTSRKVEPARYAVCVLLATSQLDVNKKVFVRR